LAFSGRTTFRRRAVALVAAAVLSLIAAPHAVAQPPSSSAAGAVAPSPVPNTPSTPLDDTIDAGEADNASPARNLVKWNEYEGPFFTLRFGAGWLYDYATYSQDDDSKEQIELTPDGKLRDFRVLFKGKLKFNRPTTWSAGIMYDAANDKWLFRQTGIMVSVPEIRGDLFVGRTKEGVSLNKVMVGYAGWAMERSQASDAMLPILADGVKWLGYLPEKHLIWNLGVYGDVLSEGQSFSTYDNQVSGRFAWVGLLSDEGRTLLHIGVNARYGTANDGKLRLRARPGAWPAPYFLDTGEFAAKGSTMTGLEAYYRPGRMTYGVEYFLQNVNAPDSGNPFFHGGEAMVSWLLTGEVRTYNARGGYFNLISPARPVFQGGPGAWELVGDVTYSDFDDAAISGGKYWRFTPMLNWYVSDNMRLEVAYGYGSLDRFALVGKTQFFQTRIQLQF
jgi:phosphate-selective porin OprO/OprP